MSKSYNALMAEAYAYTYEMKLNTSDIKLCSLPSSISIDEITIEIMSFLLDKKKTSLQELAFNCFPISIIASKFLQKHYGIHPILTSGNLLLRNEFYFFEEKKTISNMLINKEENASTAKFHTWLTLGQYVIDLTLMSTEFVIDETNRKYRYQSYEYCAPIAYDHTSNNRRVFTHQPVFLGEDYFNHVKFKPTPRIIKFNQNIE